MYVDHKFVCYRICMEKDYCMKHDAYLFYVSEILYVGLFSKCTLRAKMGQNPSVRPGSFLDVHELLKD